MTFKNDNHKSDYHALLETLQTKGDKEYAVLAYLLTATGKLKALKDCFDAYHVDIDSLYEKMKVFSPTEKAMIRFGVQCYNDNLDSITLGETLRGLDEHNEKVVLHAINVRYFTK